MGLHKLSSMIVAAAVVLGLLSDRSALATTYTTVDLHPGGFDYSYGFGVGGGQQVGWGSDSPIGGYEHALLWAGMASSMIDLNPSGFYSSAAYGANGTQQVGYGSMLQSGAQSHALLWSGTAGSMVDLHPSGFGWSYAVGIGGAQQVGVGGGEDTGGYDHALLWTGTASSVVDLHPSGFDWSFAYSTTGTQQVGHGDDHALLWTGTANSVVDLHPSGFDGSYAYSTTGTQQVGYGYGTATGGTAHALLWSGSAATALDLNPAGFDESYAWSTNGTQQVGNGYGPATSNYDHALLWSGTAGSALDLHQFLPGGFTTSHANAIDAQGNIVGYAIDASGNSHAMLWQPVPEPGTLAMLGILGVCLGGYVWRKRKRVCLNRTLLFFSTVLTSSRRSLTTRSRLHRVFVASFLLLAAGTAQAVTIDLVTVGNPGNVGDTEVSWDDNVGYTTGYGAVDHVYQIGKYEVTNAQWRTFLAAKAAVGDPHGLYNAEMAGTFGGIARSGSGTVGDPWVYSAKGSDAAWDDRPVNFVSFWDAARFCNWLHNGQGGGDTESGAYVNIGNQNSFARQTDARWCIPSEDEWYKAAYHKNDGPTGNYWDYPTGSDTVPSNQLIDPDPGNNANFWSEDGYTIDGPYWTTKTGEFEESASAYGTFDQGGNLLEWNETAVTSSTRGWRGGHWGGDSVYLHASDRYFTYSDPADENFLIGFRTASISVPEPSTWALLAMAVTLTLSGRRLHHRFQA